MIEQQELVIEEFGPYLVYERLGVGGMATVHRALERGIEDFERVVALKRLLPHLAEDASFIKSFVREAKLASTLQHANIVQTLELGRVGPTYFISMEYIDGRDIRRILRHARKVSGPPPINVTLALMLQLCDALDYAHNRCDANDQPLGLVHRDLSPSNLLLTRSGHLKVIDFGIAKAQSAALATQTGRVKGKLAYMAPESIAGKELDARSDLFAAGVVFHELLTARPLFAQKNEYQTLLKVQRGDVAAPSTFNEGVPKELDDIVLKALARDPEDRWANAAALRDALVSVRMARQLSATPRDVTTWCDWAFSLEMGGFSGKTFTEGLVSGGFGNTASPLTRTPLPARPSRPNQDEEAAAEIAWGAPEQEGRGVPHIHDEVPDVSNKIVGPSALAAAAVDVGLTDASTDETPAFDPAVMDSAASTQPDMQASTIKTLAVPPPKGELRPAAFPAGSSDDALRRARPRTITIPPKAPSGVSALGTSPPTLRGPAPTSRPPPIPAAATARGSTTNLLEDLDGPPPTPPHMVPARARDTTGRRPSVAVARPTTPTEVPTIGASIASRETHPVRNAIIALLVLGGAATAITLAVIGRGDDVTAVKEPAPQGIPMRTTGTVKFVIEPADAVIKLSTGAPHTGSPWQTELAAGLHQIEIHRDGYKSWLTSVELSAGETQTLRVVLEQVVGAGGATPVDATATLIVDPSVPGLEVVLDGVVLDGRTPLRTEVKPGPHRVVLRQDGDEAWSHSFTAVANATHSFDPSMSDDKKRERRRRREHLATTDDDDDSSRWTRADPQPTPTVKPPTPANLGTTTPTQPPPANPTIGTSTPAPIKPAPTPVKPTPTTTPPTPTPTPTPVKPAPTPPTPAIVKPTPTPAPANKGPVLIPPSKVTRTSGSVPELRAKGSSLASEALPKQISAKVCIDTTGAVSSAKVLSKVPPEVKKTLEAAIRGWRYSQYKENGIALSACFVASFRSE